MRCNRHPRPPGSVGVCPSCLRERLAAVAEALAGEGHRNYDALPPPLILPRSVSPYICRRSETSHGRYQNSSHSQLFYSTPLSGPNFAKEKKSRLSIISRLFGASRSEEIHPDPSVSKPPLASSSYTSNWLSNFRKKKSRLFSVDDRFHGGRRSSHPVSDRGMSPEREDGLPTGSWYSCESSPGWRKSASETSMPTPSRRGLQLGRNVSSFAFCLSPLVRPCPNRRQPLDSNFSAELRRANRQHLSTAASICPNRSRKFAEFGRYP